MTKKNSIPTVKPQERVLLVGVEVRGDNNILSLEESLEELSLLSDTAGLNVVGQLEQRLNKPNPKTYVGSGKVEEIKQICESFIIPNTPTPHARVELD